MAVVRLDGDDVVVELTGVEKAESVHGDVRFPRASVRSAEVVDDPVNAFQGFKVIGSRLPGSFAIGTFRCREGTLFAVVHRHTARGVRLDLVDASYDVVLVGCDDPASVVELLEPRT